MKGDNTKSHWMQFRMSYDMRVLVTALAGREKRTVSDMLRILIADGMVRLPHVTPAEMERAESRISGRGKESNG